MKMVRSSSLLITFAAAFFICVAHASPQLQHLRAVVHATEALTPTGQAGIFTVQINGNGIGLRFGRLTFQATETIDFASTAGTAIVTNGKFTITAANGDQLFATYVGSGMPDPANPAFVLGSATATLTGGTGRFACASGTVPFFLRIDPAALTEVITFATEAVLVDRHCRQY